MAITLSRPRIIFAKIVHDLDDLRADQCGTVAVMMALLFPIVVGGLGLGFEISNWYLNTRSMQNAADTAAMAAAANGGSNYDVEAKAVSARYGFVDGSNNVTVAASNTAACPAGGNTCYSVTISNVVPLYLSQVVGYTSDITVNGVKQKRLSSAAIAQQATIQQPICLLALRTNGQAIQSNGGPKTNFNGCSVMSNSAARCNGSNLQATYGLAHGSSDGCGYKQVSNVPVVPDPFSALATNIPTNTCNTYPQEPSKKNDPALPAGNQWSTQKTFSGNVQMCGDVQLTADVTINATTGAVIVIQNGQLDLNGYNLRTANGSAVTIVFSGTTAGNYTHAPTDNSTGQGGTLDIQAPTSGTWSGVAIYQDPNLNSGVDVIYKGNNPAWDISGLVYMPHSSVTVSGAVNKSSNGAGCMVMVANNVLINGTGSFYDQSPAGCLQAGLNMPTATIPSRSKLVY